MVSRSCSDANVRDSSAPTTGAATTFVKRGPTEGKGTTKQFKRNGYKRFPVKVNGQLNAFVGEYATKVANEFGVQIRASDAIMNAEFWKDVDVATKDAIFAAVCEKYEIEGYGSKTTNEIINKKCQELYRGWKTKAKEEYLQVLQSGKNPYVHSPSTMTAEQFKHMITHVWKSEKHQKRSDVNKINCSKKAYNHTMGSRSFAAAISVEEIDIDKGDQYTEFFKKSHQSAKTGEWIDPLCEQDYNGMKKIYDESLLQESEPVTGIELSQRMFGQKKSGYLKGYGPGKKALFSSNLNDSSNNHAKEVISELKSEVDTLKETCTSYKEMMEAQEAMIQAQNEKISQLSDQQVELIRMMLTSRSRGDANSTI